MLQHNGTRIDNHSIRVLKAIHGHDGRLNTSEAKSLTGIDDNDKVRRRFEKLADADLVEVSKGDADTHYISPKVAEITPKGVEKAKQWDIRNDLQNQEGIEDKLDRISNQLSSLESRVDELERAADGNDDGPSLRETRLLTEAIRRWSVEEFDADLGRHYPG